MLALYVGLIALSLTFLYGSSLYPLGPQRLILRITQKIIPGILGFGFVALSVFFIIYRKDLTLFDTASQLNSVGALASRDVFLLFVSLLPILASQSRTEIKKVRHTWLIDILHIHMMIIFESMALRVLILITHLIFTQYKKPRKERWSLRLIYFAIGILILGYSLKVSNPLPLQLAGEATLFLVVYITVGFLPFTTISETNEQRRPWDDFTADIISAVVGIVFIGGLNISFIGEGLRDTLSILFIFNGIIFAVSSWTSDYHINFGKCLLRSLITLGFVAYVCGNEGAAYSLWLIGIFQSLIIFYGLEILSRGRGKYRSLKNISKTQNGSNVIYFITMVFLFSCCALPFSPNLFVLYDFLLFVQYSVDSNIVLILSYTCTLFIFISAYRVIWCLIQAPDSRPEDKSIYGNATNVIIVTFLVLFFSLTFLSIPDIYTGDSGYILKNLLIGYDNKINPLIGITFQQKNFILLIIILITMMTAGGLYFLYSNSYDRKLKNFFQYNAPIFLHGGLVTEISKKLMSSLFYNGGAYLVYQFSINIYYLLFDVLFQFFIDAITLFRNWLFKYRPKGINSNLLYIHGLFVLVLTYCLWN